MRKACKQNHSRLKLKISFEGRKKAAPTNKKRFRWNYEIIEY